MSQWSRFKSLASGANTARKAMGQAKNFRNEVKENGIVNTAKNHLNRKARQKARKIMMTGLKSFGRFLLTPPWGWLTALGIFIIFTMLGNAMDSSGIDKSSGHNRISEEEYAALQMGCPVNKVSPDTPMSIDLQPGQTKWSFDQVKKFANDSIRSTWGVSSDKAAKYFLNRNAKIATKYGLNASNIGKITETVQKAGVSPVYFYLYAVNEGGGAGGFINHYTTDSGQAVPDAKRDAEYIANMANQLGGRPATSPSEMPGLPTSNAQKFLDTLPAGSFGRIYLQATAATTGEIEQFSGTYKSQFGLPMSDMMTAITQLGGDINSGDTIGEINAFENDSPNCGTDDDANGSLVDGGLTLDQAYKFMQKFYDTPINVPVDAPGALTGIPDPHTNCTVFSSWFIKKYTDLTPSAGDGGTLVAKLLANPLNSKAKETKTPTAYSVFSIDPGADPLSTGPGHTGIVLGIDKKRNKAIIGEAMWNFPFTSVSAPLSGVNAIEVELSRLSNPGWHFVDLNSHMKKNVSF